MGKSKYGIPERQCEPVREARHLENPTVKARDCISPRGGGYGYWTVLGPALPFKGLWPCLCTEEVRAFTVLLANTNPQQPPRRTKLALPVPLMFTRVLPALLFSVPLASVVTHVAHCVCDKCSLARAGSVSWNSSSLHLTELQQQPPELPSKGFGFPHQSAIFCFQGWILIRKLLNKFTGVSTLLLKLSYLF